MYRKHVLLGKGVFFVIFLLSYKLGVDYSRIAGMAITVVSIALAVYIGAASMLLGSAYAKQLQMSRNNEDKTKTNLGVLASYLYWAGYFSISTLIISCVYILNINWQSLVCLIDNDYMKNCILFNVFEFFSAISCGIFFVNIIFIWLILRFLINAILKSTR